MSDGGGSNSSQQHCFVTSPASYILSFFSMLAALCINTPQIWQYLKNFRTPCEQKWIVRMLLIVPLYSLASFICLLTVHTYAFVYIQALRDCYEAFLIYAFLSLCFTYLGGELAILSSLNGQTIKRSFIVCTCCIAGRSFNVRYIRFCKRATLQFCIVKPIVSILIIILQSLDLFHEGDFSSHYGYVYITVVYNLSYTLALYGFFFFYFMAKDYLAPFHPLSKFITIKFIMFLSYWQALLLTGLAALELINPCGSLTRTDLSNALQFFLVSIEMIIVAIMLRFSFPLDRYTINRIGSSSPYEPRVAPEISAKSSLLKVFDPRDFIKDTLHNFSSNYRNYVFLDASTRGKRISITNDRIYSHDHHHHPYTNYST